MNKLIIGIAALLLPLATMADGHEAAIAERQAAFKEIKEAVAAVKDTLKSEDFAAAEESAQTILKNAEKVTELFPEGSYEGDTRAKKKIWKKFDDFQSRQQTLVTHAEELVTASQSGDAKTLKAAFKTVSKDCKGCHMKYRQIF